LGFEKSQRTVTHDSLRCINILTYLLACLLMSAMYKRRYAMTGS